MHRLLSSLAVTLMLTGMLATPASALNSRTWLSGTGTDTAGCGPIATPCRTLQYALDNTATGGEIDVKDSAGYGSVIIGRAISIIGDGVLAGILAPANGAAISINAGASDIIVLRGLTIEGAGVASRGIVVYGGGNLDIANCVIQGFANVGGVPGAGSGIVLQPAAGAPFYTIVGTTVSHNAGDGVFFLPVSSSSASTTIVIDHLTAIDNTYGVDFNDFTGGAATRANISNSVLSKNREAGLKAANTPLKLAIDNTAADANAYAGFETLSGAVTIGRSSASNNGFYGFENSTATLSSYGDNRLSGNGLGPIYGSNGPATLY